MFRSSVFFKCFFLDVEFAQGKYGLLHGCHIGAAVEVGAYYKSTTPGSWEQEVVKMDVATAISCALLEHSQW